MYQMRSYGYLTIYCFWEHLFCKKEYDFGGIGKDSNHIYLIFGLSDALDYKLFAQSVLGQVCRAAHKRV